MKQIDEEATRQSVPARAIEIPRPGVLLVDDQPARLLTYEAILEGVGVDCVRALSGREALNRLLRQSFALILLDVSMPEMDGFETARLIREHPRFERTPIIFVTGVHVSQLDSLRGYEVGAIDYIPVPVVPEILRSKVALLVELYRRRAELELLNRELESTRARLEAERAEAAASNQAQLHESERRYRAIFEHPMAVTVVLKAVRSEGGDIVDWRYVDANANALKLSNHSRDALLGMRLSDAEPDRAEFLKSLIGRVLTDRSPQRYEIRLGEADYLMCLFPMGSDEIIRSGVDITERVRDERETQRLMDAGQAEKEGLRDAGHRKDEFIAMLAHELRNPLVPIRTGIELLKKARDRIDIVDTVRPMMERQIGHMVRLIDDLLDVSRITSGKLVLQRRPVTLSSIIGNAIEPHREAISTKNLKFSVNLPEPRWILNVDPTRLSQAISNLLENAVKFTPAEGKVTLDAVISSTEGDSASELVLKVIDSGEGVSAEILPQIFDPFGPWSATSHAGRSGLGLGLTRRLIEMHGGTIEARSSGPDQGSEFTIRLPAPRDLQPQHASRGGADQSLEGLRVLVIDDNEDAADVIGLLVEDMGGTVRVVKDGASGLAALPDFRPEVVLLDIGMPGMDGYETCRRMRATGSRIGIVAITGWGQEHDKQLAMEAGFDAHITKPADPTKIRDVIREVHRAASPQSESDTC
jgi:signal transduction histidine kinase